MGWPRGLRNSFILIFLFSSSPADCLKTDKLTPAGESKVGQKGEQEESREIRGRPGNRGLPRGVPPRRARRPVAGFWGTLKEIIYCLWISVGPLWRIIYDFVHSYF